jgi:hypothetical protein
MGAPRMKTVILVVIALEVAVITVIALRAWANR